MKPRRLLLHAPLLPTISECLEDVSTPCLPPSLDEYAASIRALARPTSALPGPIRSPRGQRPHPHARARHQSCAPHACRIVRPCHAPVAPSNNNDNSSKDPLDWSFAHTPANTHRTVQTHTLTHRHSQTDVRPRTQGQRTGHTDNFMPTLWML
ncbi:hypothetical protein AALO_G00237160 [Alosa alosa]|uniref:Uncharacterized protein n=1 Tax=Alosa alosa TaxID=278164 RepID=A0AAV6FVK9_9TELE|nr:hypothetical protein AALO_G00237160 [Alosa alosa]